MILKKSLILFIISALSSVLLIALPQDLKIFTDFENVSGEGTIYIGVEPNVITLVGFTVETLEDPAQLHSGTKALTLGPGQEGQIISNRGLQFLQLYAGETTGAGKIEVRGVKNVGSAGGADFHTELVVGGTGAGGITTGLPTNISPGANPTLYSWVGDSGDFFDTTDLDFHNGIQNVKFFNVTGKLVIDDLGFTLTDFPSNNTVLRRV